MASLQDERHPPLSSNGTENWEVPVATQEQDGSAILSEGERAKGMFVGRRRYVFESLQLHFGKSPRLFSSCICFFPNMYYDGESQTSLKVCALW